MNITMSQMRPNLRSAKLEDIPEIFSFTEELVLYYDETEIFYQTPESLKEDMEENLFMALVLDASDNSSHRIEGAIVFCPEYSKLHGGWGLYIDLLYIRPEKRKHGLGRWFLNAMYQTFNDINFAKVIFKHDEQLSKLYANLGYKNRCTNSANNSQIHLYEIEKAEINKYIKKEFPCVGYKLTESIENIEFHPISLSSKHYTATKVNINTNSDDLSPLNVSFTIQMVHCTWMSRIVLLSDLEGNIEELLAPNPSIFKRHVLEVAGSTDDNLDFGIWFEVPVNAPKLGEIVEEWFGACNVTNDNWMIGAISSQDIQQSIQKDNLDHPNCV